MASKTQTKAGKTLSTERRTAFEAIYLQIAIRVKYMILQWGGLKPFILGVNSRPSFCRPKNAPKYDFVTRFGFVFLWFVLGVTRQSHIFYFILCKIGVISQLSKLQDFLSTRLIKQMKAQGWNGGFQEFPLPEFDWKNKTPDEFFRTYVEPSHPVVLRGFMKENRELLKQLGWDEVMAKYSEEDVLLTNIEKDGFPGKLKEVDNPKTYLHNSEVIFLKYPHIRNLLDYQKLEPYTRKKAAYEQLFIGRQGTGTPFHRAASLNAFYMIDGTKRWWFVDPHDSYLMYPTIFFGKAAMGSQTLWPRDGNIKDFPLFQYAPLFIADLQPGDVVWNPAWWWHAIKNTSPTTVAIASRWQDGGISGKNYVTSEEDYEIDRFATMGFLAGKDSWSFLHSTLQTPTPRYDEHTSLREIKSRFSDKQNIFNRDGGIIYGGVCIKG